MIGDPTTISNPEQILPPTHSFNPVPILNRKLVKTCHVILPDMPRPVSAIAFNNKLYSYVKFYPTLEVAQRASTRLVQRGNAIILTQVPKGLVLWVFEPDAQLAH